MSNAKVIDKKNWLKNISFTRDGRMTISVPFVTCDEPKRMFRDYVRYDIMVACEDMPELPTDGNPRGINTLSPSFKGVKNCVSQDAELLQENHNGGDIFANYVEPDYKNKVLKLTFSSTGMGVINGATSMGAILYAQYIGSLKPGHMINFRVRDYHIEELTHAQRLACVEQAAKLNSVVEQTEESLCFQRGYFDNYIKELNPSYKDNGYFIFKPDVDDEDTLEIGFSSNYILRFFEAMNIKKYSPDSVPVGINSGIAGMLRNFVKQISDKDNPIDPYNYLIPMLNDFVALYGHILYHWDDSLVKIINDPNSRKHEKVTAQLMIDTLSKTKRRGYHTAYSCLDSKKYNKNNYMHVDAIVWCIFTAFRANLEVDEETNMIRWKVDPYVLWNKCNLKVLRKVYDCFVNDCDKKGKMFISMKHCWRNCYQEVEDAIEEILAEERNSNSSLCA